MEIEEPECVVYGAERVHFPIFFLFQMQAREYQWNEISPRTTAPHFVYISTQRYQGKCEAQ